ncbi:response regulator transcription factor [Pseudonocardia eucalypti]|uniref:Response regulator transcription factor n=1 Tax=Pseudonocardia eucalypti TaxID=648755 RepID=A0ABP9QGC5_9PSEU
MIEDDADVRRGFLRSLQESDFATSSAATGVAGLETAIAGRPDLIVLDLGLPDFSGEEVLRMVRAVSRVPVIVATGFDDESNIVAVLEAGADDYLVKPFGGAQLVARVRAVLRRSQEMRVRSDTRLVVGRLALDGARRTAELDGRPLSLAPKEFDLLYYLAGRPGEVVAKRELLTEVWRVPYSGTDKTVDVHVSWLRRKLGETARDARYLHTVRGVGLRLESPG